MTDPSVIHPPGNWLGVLGGGQLGRMFCHAAQAMGYRVAVLDPAADSPAGAVADRHVRADYEDAEALAELGLLCAAVTTEFENVPAASLAALAEHCRVTPSAKAVAAAQDRIQEKAFLREAGVNVAPYAAIRRAADLDAAPKSLFPGILKAARLGYDGKGQARVADLAEAQAAWADLGQVECVLEARQALALEFSMLVARGLDGAMAVYPPAQNLHRDGILAVTAVHGEVLSAEQRREAEAAVRAVAERLDYVGVLCVEFFLLHDGRILANEMAPRPHNSGHYTIDACACSQFEQQARVMAGLPLGATRLHGPAFMLNLLGDLWFDESGQQREPDWAGVLAVPGASLHLYGKTEARRARKMGHVTVQGQTLDEAREAALRVSMALSLPLD